MALYRRIHKHAGGCAESVVILIARRVRNPRIFGLHPRHRCPFMPEWLRPGLAGRWGLARHWPSQRPDMKCSATLCDLLRASRSEEAQHV